MDAKKITLVPASWQVTMGFQLEQVDGVTLIGVRSTGVLVATDVAGAAIQRAWWILTGPEGRVNWGKVGVESDDAPHSGAVERRQGLFGKRRGERVFNVSVFDSEPAYRLERGGVDASAFQVEVVAYVETFYRPHTAFSVSLTAMILSTLHS